MKLMYVVKNLDNIYHFIHCDMYLLWNKLRIKDVTDYGSRTYDDGNIVSVGEIIERQDEYREQ